MMFNVEALKLVGDQIDGGSGFDRVKFNADYDPQEWNVAATSNGLIVRRPIPGAPDSVFDLKNVERIEFQNYALDLNGATWLAQLQKLVNGYVGGARIVSDANANGRFDSGESFAISSIDGSFSFVLDGSPIVASGGVDNSTGLPLQLLLRAPSGSSTISPLTTLISVLQDTGAADPAAALRDAFGIAVSTDLRTFDHVAQTVAGNPEGVVVKAAVAQTMNVAMLVSAVLAREAGTAIAQAGEFTFAAIASAISALPLGAHLELSDATVHEASLPVRRAQPPVRR